MAQGSSKATEGKGFQPWQFFVLAALMCATATIYIARPQGVVPNVLSAVLLGATALVGIAALRTFRPLVGSHDDHVVILGGRTRAALEREKFLTLRGIKELEFDRAMGKLSESDFEEMSTRLRARAARLIRQLDASQGYRLQIEQELARRLDAAGTGDSSTAPGQTCPQCGHSSPALARFCNECGAQL